LTVLKFSVDLTITSREYARPELYIDKEHDLYERRRNRFFRRIESFPHILRYLASLTLLIDPSTCIEDTPIGQATIILLKGATHLSTLHLARPHTGCGSLSIAFLDAIPSSVTTLAIKKSPINLDGLLYLLASRPTIKTLDLSEAGLFASREKEDEAKLRLPDDLTGLKFPLSDDAWRPLFVRILAGSQPLIHYEGPSFSARYLSRLDLSRLRSLELDSKDSAETGLPRGIGVRPKSTAEVSSSLSGLLSKTPELVKLQVHLDEAACLSNFDYTLPTTSILAVLPAKLSHLSLIGADFFSNHDLLQYLASPTRSRHLATLGIPIQQDLTPDQNVVELCQDRGIKLSIVSWENYHWKNREAVKRAGQ
jgi:hypothetical protein